MAALVTAVDTDFTPAATPFTISVSVGAASLLRRSAAGTAWNTVRTEMTASDSGQIVDNPVAGTIYRFVPAGGNPPTVRADQ